MPVLRLQVRNCLMNSADLRVGNPRPFVLGGYRERSSLAACSGPDLAGPGRGTAASLRTFETGVNWAFLAEATEERRHRLLTRRIITFRKVASEYRRGEEVPRLKLFPTSQMPSPSR